MMQRAQIVPSTTDVVILCGGPGTRLGSLTAHTPKPLLPVNGQPFLLHLLLHLQEEGFTRVILTAHYLASQFRAFLADYRRMVPNTALELIIEPRPLGTGGALQYAARYVQSAVFVAMNGDSWVSQSVAPVLRDHERMGRHCTAVAVEASQVEGGAFSKGVWEATPKLSVTGFTTETRVAGGWVNAGIYVLDRAMASSWPEGQYRLEDRFVSLLRGWKAGIFQSSGRLLDIGTPACYEQASRILSVPVGYE